MDSQTTIGTVEPTATGTDRAKAKGRSKAKPKPANEAKGNGKRSLNLSIDEDSYKRLSVHALMRNTTISDLVMGFAQTLREFSIPHRLGNGSAKTEQGE